MKLYTNKIENGIIEIEDGKLGNLDTVLLSIVDAEFKPEKKPTNIDHLLSPAALVTPGPSGHPKYIGIGVVPINSEKKEADYYYTFFGETGDTLLKETGCRSYKDLIGKKIVEHNKGSSTIGYSPILE